MQSFFNNPPALHSWDGGKTWNSGGFTGNVLKQMSEAIAAAAGPVQRICETGAGNSTIAFLLMKPKELTAIAPAPELFGRIHSYCDGNQIDRRALTAVTEFSEVSLPNMALNEIKNNTWYDVALIDGGHGWPTVFVDFCYMHAMLRRGGLLIVDDTQLYSVSELVSFLKEDPRFELVAPFTTGKTLIFKKTSALRFLPDFGAQPYIVRRTNKRAK